MSYLPIVRAELEAFQVELAESQITQLALYCDEIDRWNKKINLTGLKGAELVRRLVVEPVWIGMQLELSGVMVDIGSGNGSPAIPLHILRPFANCQLVEARTRRAAFLRHVAVALGLTNVAVHRSRFEDCVSVLQEPNWVTLQAVAPTGKLLDSIRKIATQTTSIVWITSGNPSSAPFNGAHELVVPTTGTHVYVLPRDLF